jgi:hypothetical protein
MRWLVVVALLVPVASQAEESSSSLPPPSPELLAPRPRVAAQPSLHPAIVLRDAKGAPVVVSGQPASAAKTCDGCHDVGWIQSHDGHGGLVANGFDRSPALLPAGNCFLCHVQAADNSARTQAITRDRRDWIETATLAATGLVATDGDHWQWQKHRFQSDGTIPASALGIARPGNRACGFCHGRVYEDSAPLSLSPAATQRMTELEGIVFSGQRISDSAMNVANKDSLTRPWDVHAERMVSCASCHFSPNHPAYAFANRGPEHLQFDARRVAITEYLRRPDHRLAKGPSNADAGHQEGSIRRCESCHDAGKVHAFLPRAERHFGALACEACHVPMAHAPARQEEDWTMLTPEREARVVYRGIRGDGFVPGYTPVLLPRPQPDGSKKLAPSNLITTYRWVERGDAQSAGKRHPVARETLERAFFTADGYRPELVRALDSNGDGKLQEGERILDSAQKVQVAHDLLVAAGVHEPAMVGEVRSYELHHGVSPGRFATRDCSSCHAADSRIDQPFSVAASAPFGVTPALVDASTGAQLNHDSSGRMVLVPHVAGLHVFGHSRSGFLDGLGLLLFAGAIAGAGGHALLRVRSARRRNKEQA